MAENQKPWNESPWARGLARNSNSLIGLGTGLLQGKDFAEGLALGGQGYMQGAQQDSAYAVQQRERSDREKQLNQTIQWMQSKGYDDLVSAVEGGVPIATAWSEALQRAQPAQPSYGFTFAPDGSLIRTDSTSGGFETMGQFSQPEGPHDLIADAAAREQLADQYGFSGPDRQTFITTGDLPGGSSGSLTEQQSKDAVFATRAAGALEILDNPENPLAGQLTNPWARAVEGDPTGIARGAMQSPEYQMANQAGLEFLQAILRKDTGAAITPAESQEYGRVYLDQPGDSPEVQAQKKLSRLRAYEALKAGMAPDAILSMERALLNAGGSGNGGDPLGIR